MIDVPLRFRPHMKAIYPSGNVMPFEEWFYRYYVHNKWNNSRGKREYLPIFWTSILVNTNHAKTKEEVPELQAYVDSLDRSKKYYSIVQYDLGVVVDLKDLDILLFNMSENNGYPMPLICLPQSFNFKNERKVYFASFIGSNTHPLREDVFNLADRDEQLYISREPHNIQEYCRIMSQSLFALCPRGFGKNSFRIMEALQYGAIPVYYSDEFIIPHNIPFEMYGVKIDAGVDILEYLEKIEPLEIYKKQQNIKEAYDKLYTYEGNFNLIIEHLRNEA